MKPYKEILEEMKRLSEKEISNKQAIDDLNAKIRITADKAETLSERVARRKELKKVYDYEETFYGLLSENEIIRIERAILKHNAVVSFYAENMPIILDILKKYEGKSYGQKTTQKIYDLVKEKIGCGFSISQSYQQDRYLLTFGALNEMPTIDIAPKKFGDSFLVDNKIVVLPMDALEIYKYSKEYVEDVKKRALELQEKYKAILEKEKEFETTINEFNDLVVGDIQTFHRKGDFLGIGIRS